AGEDAAHVIEADVADHDLVLEADEERAIVAIEAVAFERFGLFEGHGDAVDLGHGRHIELDIVPLVAANAELEEAAGGVVEARVEWEELAFALISGATQRGRGFELQIELRGHGARQILEPEG